MIKSEYKGELQIGSVLIPCFVFEDETRVLSDSGLLKSLEIKGKGRKIGGHCVLGILNDMGANYLISKEFSAVITHPIKFEYHGKIYHGHKTNVFTKLLSVFSEASRFGLAKTEVQKRYVMAAELFRDALVNVGLDALVDEATGYQDIRERDALQKILEKYLQDNERKWVKTFPDMFWQKLVKVKGYESYTALKRPQFVGHWVNDVVYDRLAPGIKEKLNDLNPKQPDGTRHHRHHQHLTEDHGVPELKEHLIKVMALMDAAANDTQFKRMLNRVVPKYGNTIEMNLDDNV